MPPISNIDPLVLLDLREALWVLASANPQHQWRRRSGSPITQLARSRYQPSEVATDRGYKGLTVQGKWFYRQYAGREGLPVPSLPQRQDPSTRYGPPVGTSAPTYRLTEEGFERI